MWNRNCFPSETHEEFTPGFWWDSCCSISSFLCGACGSLFSLLAIVLSDLLFTPLFYSCDITGDKSWMSKVIRGHFWCRYSVTVNQLMVATLKRSKWWLQLNHYRNPWSSSFLVSSNPLSRDSWKIYRINWEIYTCTPYVGVMLLHINGKLTMGKLK
jgi:hypothetical protein